MLFDLRSAGRRRTVKTVYLGLALLMFVGFVGFSIGSSGLSGGIVDAITGNKGSGNGSGAAIKRQQAAINADARRTRTSPTNPAAWAALSRDHLQMASLGDNFDPSTGNYTAAGKRELAAAGSAWNKYVALNPKKPDEGLARQIVQAYISLNQPANATSAQEIVTEVDPSQQTFTNLAIYAYAANQARKGDLAASKAVSLAPKKQQKNLKQQLAQYKSQSQLQQIEKSQPTPTPTIG
jgi:hypothetical protein